jgi:class 3 adenylate cyclase
MGLLRALTRRMVVKVFLAIALGVGAALAIFAWKQSAEQVDALNRNTRLSAQQLADLVVGSIEHSMLEGNGIKVRDLVKGMGTRVPDAMIHIYDPRGMEVFGEKPAPPAPESLPPPVRAVLDGGERQVVAAHGSTTPQIFRPIPHEARCASCHPGEEKLRGVLALTPLGDQYRAKRLDAMAAILTSGFIRVMSAKRANAGDRVESYLEEIPKITPAVRAVGVYDREGDLIFGNDPGVPEPDLRAALVPGAPHRSLPRDGGSIEVVPLPLEARCRDCHDEQNPVRGVLAVSLDAAPADGPPAQELEQVIDTSLRNIMISELGRMISYFLDDVAATGTARDLVLYDPEGRTYYSTSPPRPMPLVGHVLAEAQPRAEFQGSGHAERVVVAQPLTNGERCARCHGAGQAVRGVVTVSLPTSSAVAVREMAMQRTLLFSGVALAIIVVLLYFLMQLLVVRPVKQIGDVAESIGRGDLNVRVSRADPGGDEVQRLGSRMNDMIQGLRAKLHLERFVSKETSKAAHGAAARASSSVGAQVGQRRAATVLFTDIRGFTGFSETVEPERVVEVLNRFLQAQADIVHTHGGDIDKFVGDELMAVFHGEDASARAVTAALAMIEAVNACRREGETLEIGAGISAGEMIHGPIGSSDRLDYTVIGDVVNTGARLCAAAMPSAVYVSTAVKDACAGLGEVSFDALEPLKLKGKREPFPVFLARRTP